MCLMRKDFKEFCNLYNLDEKESYKLLNNDKDRYLELIKDTFELDILQKTLNNLVYIKKSVGYDPEIRTKEDITMINSVTENEYINIKNFDVNKLYSKIENCTSDLYKAQQSIIKMIIPKIFIIYAEKYNENRYNNMLDRLYA